MGPTGARRNSSTGRGLLHLLAFGTAMLGGPGCAPEDAPAPVATGSGQAAAADPAECRARCSEAQRACVQLFYELYPLGPATNDAPRTAGHQGCDEEFLRCVDR